MREYITNRWRRYPSESFKVKEQCVQYKGGCCLDCKGTFQNLKVFEFHHRAPMMKCFTISTAIHLGLTLEDMKSELDKCDLLCANCHRMRKDGKNMSRLKDPTTISHLECLDL